MNRTIALFEECLGPRELPGPKVARASYAKQIRLQPAPSLLWLGIFSPMELNGGSEIPGAELSKALADELNDHTSVIAVLQTV